MIAYLNGLLAEKNPASVIVECGGVGYEAMIPLSTFDRLPATGSEVKLFTRHVVREDDEMLFAFATVDERDMFAKVTAVSGVGPKTALAWRTVRRPTPQRNWQGPRSGSPCP